MLIPFISLCLTFVFLILLLKTRLVDFALDKPNARSLHTRLTPRTGGLAVMFGVLLTWLIAHVDYSWLLLTLALVSVSLVDDVRGLSVRWRFLVQLVTCGIFVLLNHQGIHFLLLMPVWLGLVWMTNLYNFMDGSDGLAGGMGLFGFATYALAAYWSGDISLAIMSASISVSCLAFLIFNFHPAKIFMGDSGSVPLGFLAGAIGIFGVIHGEWPIWFPILVFAPFIVDATVTLLKRLSKGERLSQAHRHHYYQRLVQIGWGHKKTAIAEYMLMLLGSASALYILQYSLQLSNFFIASLLAIWILIYLLIMAYINKCWKQQLSE